MANPFGIRAEIDGVRETVANLMGLPQALRNRVLRPAVTKASRRVAKAAKASRGLANSAWFYGPVTVGLLRRSIIHKVKTYSRNGGTIVGVIGPQTGLRMQVGTRRRQGKKSNVGDPIYYDPAKIAHLVEFGHGGPHPAPAHRFMETGYKATRAENQKEFAADVESGLAQLAAKGKI